MTRRLTIISLAVLCLAGGGIAQPVATQGEVRAALAEVVEPMVQQLGNADLPTRLGAARRLARLGPAARSAAPALLHAARELEVRPEAIKALARIGPPALPELIASLADSDPFFRIVALEAMAQMPNCPADPALLRKLVEQVGPDAPGELRITASQVIAAVSANLRTQKPEAVQPLIDALIAGLGRPEPGTQVAAAAALATIGKPAVPALLARLKAPPPPLMPGKEPLRRMDTATRLGVVETVGLIGPDAADAVPFLVQWLAKDQWQLQQAAAVALGGMGPAAKPAVDKLIELAWGLPAANRPEVPGLDPLGPYKAQQAAEQALIRLGPLAEPALPLLVDELKDPRARRRLAAVETLGAIGPAGARHLGLLLDLLADPDWPNPDLLVTAIVRSGEPGIKAAGDLLDRPTQQPQLAGARIVAALARQLARREPGGPPPRTGTGAEDGPDHELRAAVTATVPAIVKLLSANSTPVAVRTACVETLDAVGAAFPTGAEDGPARAGDGPARAVDALVQVIAHEGDTDLRHKAFTALGSWGQAAVKPLVEMLSSRDATVRREALGVLGEIAANVSRAGPGTVAGPPGAAFGQDAQAAVAAIIERLGDADASTRLIAPGTLARWAVAFPPAVDLIVKSLGSDNPLVRSGAAEAAGRLGPLAAAAADRLTQLCADKAVQVRAAAAWAVGRLGEKVLADPKVRDAVLARLNDPGEAPVVRGNAAVSLAEAPSRSAELVRTLAGLLNDPKLADAAMDALRTIGGKVY